MRTIFAAAAILVLSHGLEAAQQTSSATLRIVVHDPSGAVVPNARVRIRDAERAFEGVMGDLASDGQGVAVATGLAPGTYVVEVSFPGFETRVVPLLEVDAEIVSSSHIRGLVLGGAVEYADWLLGEPFTITREVVHGDKRGRELGFPTANLLPADGYVTPGHGVYACRATIASGEAYAAATSVGVRPMFVTGRGELIEAYLLDFDGDLYDQPLRLEFLKRLRGEKRFESVDALVEQMGRDVDEARAIAG